jgi:glycerol kinase
MWQGVDELRAQWAVGREWTPDMPQAKRATLIRGWRKAIERSLDWAEVPAS